MTSAKRPVMRKAVHAGMTQKEFAEATAAHLEDIRNQLHRIEELLDTPWWERLARSFRRQQDS